MIRLLSTKILEEADKNKLDPNKFLLEELAFIKTNTVISPAIDAQIIEIAQKKCNVFFTSVNAVHAVKSKIPQGAPLWEVYAIRGKTSASLQEWMPNNKIIHPSDHIADLIQHIPFDAMQQEQNYFFKGNLSLPNLPNAFKEQNALLNEITVYNTSITAPQLNNSYDGILFFSPSGVESYSQHNTLSTDVVYFAIGMTTAQAIRNRAPEVNIQIALEANISQLIQTINSYYNTNHD